jgi:hypothetical protein
VAAILVVITALLLRLSVAAACRGDSSRVKDLLDTATSKGYTGAALMDAAVQTMVIVAEQEQMT